MVREISLLEGKHNSGFKYLSFGTNPNREDFNISKIIGEYEDDNGKSIIQFDNGIDVPKDMIMFKLKNDSCKFYTDIIDIMNFICDNVDCSKGLNSYKKIMKLVYRIVKDNEKDLNLADRIASKRCGIDRGITDKKLKIIEESRSNNRCISNGINWVWFRTDSKEDAIAWSEELTGRSISDLDLVESKDKGYSFKIRKNFLKENGNIKLLYRYKRCFK